MLDLTTTATEEGTKERQQAHSKDIINNTLRALYVQIEAGLTRVQTTILANPYGLTKEEVREYYGEGIETVDLLGLKAMELLSLVKIKTE